MARKFLADAERDKFYSFPNDITYDEMVTFFTLSFADMNAIPTNPADYNRLGFAIQICVLRFLGFVLNDLTAISFSVIEYVAKQLHADPNILHKYGTRDRTKRDHFILARDYLGFKKVDSEYLSNLTEWLSIRAMEHLAPTRNEHINPYGKYYFDTENELKRKGLRPFRF